MLLTRSAQLPSPNTTVKAFLVCCPVSEIRILLSHVVFVDYSFITVPLWSHIWAAPTYLLLHVMLP